MKKIILSLLTFVSIFASAQEISTQNIAVVETSIVLEQYTKKADLIKKLDAQLKEYETSLSLQKEEVLTRELELVKKGSDATREDFLQLEELKNDVEVNFKKYDLSLDDLYRKYMYELNSDISVAAIVVGKEMGFDIVFHRGTTFYGGTDITQEVIDFLNKGEKLSLTDKNMKSIDNDFKRYKN